MNDLISRQAAIDALRDWEMCYDWDEHCREEPKAPWVVSPSGVINKLPSVQLDTYWKEQCQSYEQTINKLRESLSTQPEIKQQAINSSDCIDRRAALDALRKMQTYKLFSGDDMLLIDQAGAQTELMLLPPAQPEVVMCKDCYWWAKQEDSQQGRRRDRCLDLTCNIQSPKSGDVSLLSLTIMSLIGWTRNAIKSGESTNMEGKPGQSEKLT